MCYNDLMKQDTAAIADFYARGHSLHETAERFELSASRIRELLMRDHPGILREKNTGRQRITLARSA
jgi:predicted DNA-binding protein YlxM (UPF0122 family)